MEKSSKVITLVLVSSAILVGSGFLIQGCTEEQELQENGNPQTNTNGSRTGHGGFFFLPRLGGFGGGGGGGGNVGSAPSARGGFGSTGFSGSAGVGS